MDIQQAIAPVPVPPAAGKSQAADPANAPDDKVEGSEFSLLLQNLKQTSKLQEVDASTDLALQSIDVAALGQGLSLNDVHLVGGELNIHSLVSQTQRLDAEKANLDAETVNLDVQDDQRLLVEQEIPLLPNTINNPGWGAQPHIAAGQHVATVAAGVQTGLYATVKAEAQTAMAAASAVLAQASDLAESAPQSLTDGLLGDTADEGRVALQGAWKLEDPQLPLNPAFQRVIGQVEQWGVASMGLQPKPNERAEGSKSAAITADLLSAGQGSGTRLTENAVKEAQQAQDAAFDSHNDAPVQDMRFWLQGKQQRAEVVLEKDGQPVRVQVSLRGNEAHVTFKADQAQTRELLDASLNQLREMLEQQGVELTGVSVQADARGDSSPQGQGSQNPWETGPVQHGQVAVSVADASVSRRTNSHGIDLYA